MVGLACGIVSANPAHSQNGDEVATVHQQAVQLYQAGKFAGAVPVLERYVKLTQERVGSDHADYTTALHVLGRVYYLTKRFETAATVIRQSVAVREKLEGPHHPMVADSLLLLAEIERVWLRYAGEALVRRALAIREASFGPEHLLVANALAALAIACDQPQCDTERETLLKRVIAIREKVLALRDPLALRTHFALADFYWSHGSLDESERIYVDGISEWEQLSEADQSELAFYLFGLGNVTRALGRLDDAKRLHLRALAINEKIDPPDNTRLLAANSALAEIANAQGSHADAVRAYEGILRIDASDIDAQRRLAHMSTLIRTDPVALKIVDPASAQDGVRRGVS